MNDRGCWLDVLGGIVVVASILSLVLLETLHAPVLVDEKTSLTMLVAKDWLVLIIRGDFEVLRHLVPVVDPAFLRGASDMATFFAIFVLALDHSPMRSFFAGLAVAGDTHCQRADLPIDCLVALVSVPDSLQPVDTNDVRPKLVTALFTSAFVVALSDRLHNAVDLWAEGALYFCALLLWIGQKVSAPRTIPVAFGHGIEQLTAVA